MTGNYEKIVIQSAGELARIERFIEEMLDYYNIPGEYFGNILLAVTETVKLGAKQNKPVTIVVRKTARGVSFSVSREESSMKEMDELDKAIAHKAIARETFIIRSLADQAELKDEGKTLVLDFTISGIGLERALKRSEKVKSYLARKEKVMDRNG